MPVVQVDIKQEAYETLVALAIHELRPTMWQATVLLEKAIREASSGLRPSATDSVRYQDEQESYGVGVQESPA